MTDLNAQQEATLEKIRKSKQEWTPTQSLDRRNIAALARRGLVEVSGNGGSVRVAKPGQAAEPAGNGKPALQLIPKPTLDDQKRLRRLSVTVGALAKLHSRIAAKSTTRNGLGKTDLEKERLTHEAYVAARHAALARFSEESGSGAE